MQEGLPRIARELRKETCPQHVLDDVVAKIAAETPSRTRFPYSTPVALAGTAILCGVLVWSQLSGGNGGRKPGLVQQQAIRRMQAAHQAESALGLIGTVLLDAGARSEGVISDRAIAPLRNGLEAATSKIIRQTEP